VPRFKLQDGHFAGMNRPMGLEVRVQTHQQGECFNAGQLELHRIRHGVVLPQMRLEYLSGQHIFLL